MINIQLRGLRVEININSISEQCLKTIMNDISLKKKSLAELTLESGFSKISTQINNLKTYKNPLLSNKTELIVTAFDNNDYYSDGYSFYREKVNNIIQAPQYENFKMNNNGYLLVNHKVYYGCVFETELNQLDYQYFNSDYFSISSKKIPFIEGTLIDELFFNRLPLKDLNRSKVQLVKIRSALIDKNQSIDGEMINEKKWPSLKYIIKSEKLF